jgi:exodeoxyribonuclease VII small subunit
MASKKEKASEGFEALYQRLDETVQKLENGGLTLKESVTMYEEGMKLAKRCQELLQEAELKVTRLQESFEESIGALRDEVEEYESEMHDGDVEDE